MRVKRDFEQVYRAEEDPWSIGGADSPRYELYRGLVLEHARRRGTLLDLGCGLGAFLGRFENDFDRLVGMDVSALAIEQARRRLPGAELLVGTVEGLELSPLDGRRFDFIVYSDVICYLEEDAKRASLKWVADHLEPEGVALIACWCPGGNYPEPEELAALVGERFRILHREVLASGHALFLAERKRRLVALTFDYETWQPIPPNRRIDWQDDVLAPTERLLEAFDAVGAKVTLFAEVAEYLWLRENEPDVAGRMEEQWRDAVSRGHDVQLHLHPVWLPELGARRDGDRWHWDGSLSKAADYPGDLTELIGRCRKALEDAIRPVEPGYRVSCFRAGAYQAQPFRRLASALVENGIAADSSVYAGGVSAERDYDYSLAYSVGDPYYASLYDPQLKAPPGERGLIELPIRTLGPGDRLLLDGEEGERYADRLLRAAAEQPPSIERRRRRRRISQLAGTAYALLGDRARRSVNRVLPKPIAWAMTGYGPERLVGHDYVVAIGHTKGALRIAALAEGARRLGEHGFEVVTISELLASARQELEDSSPADARSEADFQVRRERSAVLGEQRNTAQSRHLQELIPLDHERVLDLGCGAGHWSARIAELFPWMHVTGVDVGDEFVEAAQRRFGSDRVSFVRGDFQALPFPDGSFDCVYADNSLEHAFDVDRTLAEAARVLRSGGALVAAIPSDARNPGRSCDNHRWKTAPHEIELRLRNAGFVNVELKEIDTFRRLGMPPYPPSRDRMCYVRAWKRAGDATRLDRAVEAMGWVHRRLSPDRSSEGHDPVAVLAGGHAFCTGYSVALGGLLRREGYPVRWVTMLARRHARGRGEAGIEAHAVVEVDTGDRVVLLDSMTDTCIPQSLREVLADPELAVPKASPDERYRERGYELYDTEYWYGRVFKYRRPKTPAPRIRVWRRNEPRGL